MLGFGKNKELPQESLLAEGIAGSKESLGKDLNHEVVEDLQVLAQAVDKFDKLAEQAKTPEQKEKIESLRSRAFEVAKKFLRFSSAATLGSMLALSIDFCATRNTIEKKLDSDGNMEYFHPDRETTRILNTLSGKGYYSSKISNILWRIEEECGSPNVRFQTTGPSIAGIELGPNIARPYFNSLSNTVFIPDPQFLEPGKGGIEHLLAELSHSKQLGDNPLNFYAKAVASLFRILGEGGLDAKKLSKAQDKEYDLPGSLENEAHSLIEPELTKKYKDIAQGK